MKASVNRIKDGRAIYLANGQRYTVSRPAKSLGDQLETKGYKQKSLDEAFSGDKYFMYELPLDSKGDIGITIFDMAVYTRLEGSKQFRRCYIEFDGVDHNSSNDAAKEKRARDIKAEFFRISFDPEANMTRDGEKLTVTELLKLVAT